jgi:sulfofructose kinase
MAVSRHPLNDGKCQADGMDVGGGGPAANAAVAVARLGGTSAFIGYLGNDVFGDLHISELASAGVDASLVVRGVHPSPVSVILAKPDGARSVVNYKGGTPWLDESAIDPEAVAALKPKVILFDGHEPHISARLVQWAGQHGIPTVLDAGSVHKGTEALAPLVDYLVTSSRFACDYCQTDDPNMALPELSRISPHAVVTLGAKGLIWAAGDSASALPAFDVEAVDTTGAGDAFHGAFALGVARGMAWDDLLRFASAAAALACTKLGARRGLPHAADVEAFMEGGP